MAQASSLVQTLKAQLRAEKRTYADVAKVLSLSEASVKRLFATEDFTLDRLDRICQMLGIEIADLVTRMREASPRLELLSVAQEREIVGDLVLLLVAVCVLNRWSIEDILHAYALDEGECVAKLLKLDRLGLIDLLPGNRIKLKVAPHFGWRDRGPIETFFRETIGQEFFASSFARADEHLIVLNGMLSAGGGIEFRRKLERLAREFAEVNEADAAFPFGERHGITLVLAMRHWEYGLFRHLLRS